MKKFVLAPDSFKGTMSSVEICRRLSEVILRHVPDAEIAAVPVADGGEGTVDAFLTAMGGQRIPLTVPGPLGDPTEAFYGLVGDTAVVEMAAAAGLPLVYGRRDPKRASTYGVGLLLKAAAGSGVRRIVVGLGGSATNDGGCGAAAACGIRFLDGNGRSFVPVGGTLADIASVDTSGLLPALRNVEIVTMCDIDNPLTGPRGAACVFAPQKGADPETVALLDLGLRHLAAVVRRDLGVEIEDMPGAGAAGGCGGGMAAFFGSRLQPGIETVLDVTGFDRLAADADLVITGEGRIDSQSLGGKVVVGVARRARRLGVPVVALVGDIEDPMDALYGEGVTGIFTTNRRAIPYREAKLRAAADLTAAADNLLRFLTDGGLRRHL